MDETPKRSWHLLLARTLVVALTVLLALGIGALEFEMAKGPPHWRDRSEKPDGSFSVIVRDATPTPQRWANGLTHFALLALLSTSLVVTYAFFRNTQQKRRRALWVAVGIFLLAVASVVGNNLLRSISNADLAKSDPLRPQALDRGD